jgi:two-component system NarL family sensor kinase
VVQEALTNVHRHADASGVNIRLRVEAQNVRVVVDDNGTGIPKKKLDEIKCDGGTGVGLAGMRERVRDLGGSFGIESDESGTSLRISIPIGFPEEAADERRLQEASAA